jgi:hypothetical protein
MLVILTPFRVASPIGSHPAMIPALIHDASFPYAMAATRTGTDPVPNLGLSICSNSFLEFPSAFCHILALQGC